MSRKSVFVGALLASLVFSLPVLAATPNNQACVGKDFSGYARDGTSGGLVTFDSGSGFGGFIAFLASGTGVDGLPGFGGEIQNHMAGLVPDFVIPNSCNNL